MQGKVVVITGATSGIGEVAARELARKGARIVFIARNPAKAEATLNSLRQAGPGVEHAAYIADLSSISETKRVAAEIAAAEPRIDVLINNAGALFYDGELTADGLEKTFAVNHMAYFVLTEGLTERLIASAPARIVSTSSALHVNGKLDLDHLRGAKSPTGQAAYARSKLCNILFTRELARRLAGTGVTANSLHPGLVATPFIENATGFLKLMLPLIRLMAVTPEKGAETIVYLASSPEVDGVSGLYFDKCAPKTTSAAAQDDDTATRLWSESERLAASVAPGG